MANPLENTKELRFTEFTGGTDNCLDYASHTDPNSLCYAPLGSRAEVWKGGNVYKYIVEDTGETPDGETIIKSVSGGYSGTYRWKRYEAFKIVALGDLSDVDDSYAVTGQVLIKAATNYSFSNIVDIGAMLSSTYDPRSIAADAFDMDNMTEGATNLILTSAERTAIQENSAKVSFPGFTSLDVDYGVTLAPVATSGDYNDLTGTPTIPNVSDEPYDSTTWDGNMDAPTKNAIRDKIETLGGGHDPVTLDINADTLLSLSNQELGLDAQAANLIFAGPASGTDAVPTFRSLVTDDIPDLSSLYLPLHGKADTAGHADTVTNGVYTTDAGTVFLEPNGDGSGLTGVVKTETDPVVGAVNGIVKSDGAGNITAAIPGTDYAEALGPDENYVTDAQLAIINNTSGVNTGDEVAASDSVAGIVELATISETSAGTDTTRAITPAGLAGSDFGKRVFSARIVDSGTALDGTETFVWYVPAEFNGWKIVNIQHHIDTASTSGAITFTAENTTNSTNITSTNYTIDQGETSTNTAATPGVIDAANNILATDDKITFGISSPGTGSAGWQLTITLQK